MSSVEVAEDDVDVEVSESETPSVSELGIPEGMEPELVTFHIKGLTPLLQNNPAEFIGKEEDNALAVKKKYDDEEEARLRVYPNMKDGKHDGTYGHPSQAFVKSMIRAVTGRKFGKYAATTIIKGSCFVTGNRVTLEDEDGKPLTKWEIDRQTVVVGKARILRCRPSWYPWFVKLTLEIDVGIITPSQIRASLSLAGRIAGVGDYRPEKTGGWGRYVVIG